MTVFYIADSHASFCTYVIGFRNRSVSVDVDVVCGTEKGIAKKTKTKKKTVCV